MNEHGPRHSSKFKLACRPSNLRRLKRNKGNDERRANWHISDIFRTVYNYIEYI